MMKEKVDNPYKMQQTWKWLQNPTLLEFWQYKTGAKHFRMKASILKFLKYVSGIDDIYWYVTNVFTTHKHYRYIADMNL